MTMKQEALAIRKDAKTVWFAAAGLMLALVLASGGCSKHSSEHEQATHTVAAMGDVISTQLTLQRMRAEKEVAAIQGGLDIPDSACADGVRDAVLFPGDVQAQMAQGLLEKSAQVGRDTNLEALPFALKAAEEYGGVHRHREMAEDALLDCKAGGAQ